MTRRIFGAIAVLGLGMLVACGEEDSDTLRVLAASSLTDVFSELAVSFEETHPGVEVELSFGSSTDLAGQAADGAPGAVLATADEASMTIARDTGAAEPPTAFAGNVVVLATPAGNPAEVTGLADLADVTWVRCADDVPCGRAAASILADAGVDDEPDSLEEDARSTLDKVVAGEADAALVYRTDALAAGEDVATVPLAEAEAVPSMYFIAALQQAPDDALAAEFVALVLSEAGTASLRKAGFVTP